MKNKILAAVGLATLGLLAYMVYPFADIIVYGIFVYYIARPLYERILPRLKSSWISSYASIFILALPLMLVALYTIGVASIELSHFIRTVDIPALQPSSYMINETSMIAREINAGDLLPESLLRGELTATNVVEALSGRLSSLVWELVSRTLSIIFKLFLVSVVSFYFIADGGKIRKTIKEIIFPKDETAEKFLDEVDAELSSVFYGNILTAAVIAILGALTFNTINLLSNTIEIPYPVLMGILCGITSLIPVVGVGLVWAPLTAYLTLNAAASGMLGESALPIILFLATTYAIVDWLPNIILRARMSGRKTHKGLLLLSYIFGPIVFGLKGLFLGPIIVVFAVNYAEIVLPKLLQKR